MYSSAAVSVASKIGLKMGRANLEVFADTLQELAKADRNILAVTSDSRGSGKLGPYATALPDQLVELGIAEQNLVGVAAGLASAGKIVYAVSPACFLSARSFEQIKNDVAYSDHPVKLIAISSGVSYGALGSTHHSLHDLAALRAVNNLDIVVPADNFETKNVIRASASRTKPIYIRFGKAPLYDLPRTTDNFEIGKASEIRAGSDVAFIATGECVIHALLAAESLKDRGLNCSVTSLHSVKPLDAEAILNAARQSRAVVTVEEHMVNGGLGEAVAAVLMQAGVRVPLRIVGIPDEHTVTGSQADIFRHYGISMEGLSQTASALLK